MGALFLKAGLLFLPPPGDLGVVWAACSRWDTPGAGAGTVQEAWEPGPTAPRGRWAQGGGRGDGGGTEGIVSKPALSIFGALIPFLKRQPRRTPPPPSRRGKRSGVCRSPRALRHQGGRR